MAAKIFRINYKSDFILTLNSDAGWMTPFCIKFWTGVPSQAFFVGWDGTTYTHCSYDPGEPTKLLVQFDDHHLPIGDLKFQIAYHFTVADFPNDTEDEVINPANITTEIDGEAYQVMLDFTGETAPEIQFSLPAYANEAQRIANEEQRIAHEAIRIVNEESRIAAETIRQQNEAQRIAQETARVNEFATLKSQSQAATRDANDAATLANQKAQLAQDKAALADDAATLAIQKAQLAADKAALANDAAQLAADKAALAQQKAEYAQQQGSYAKDQGDYAKNQGDYAKEQGDTAQADHERAEADHGTAVDDHTRAESDHGIAVDDHTQAGNDHTRAESDHGIAVDDHTQAGNDHTRAESDHGIAADDHTQAGNDHTRAESDHTRAESDHAAVEVYVDSLGAFDISSYHATGGVLAKYADLTAALGTNGANIPEGIRKGGMSVKFVQSSDNNYVQYMYIGTDTTGSPNPFLNTDNWQKYVEQSEVDDIKDAIGASVITLETTGSSKSYIPTSDGSTTSGGNNYKAMDYNVDGLKCILNIDSLYFVPQSGYTTAVLFALYSDAPSADSFIVAGSLLTSGKTKGKLDLSQYSTAKILRVTVDKTNPDYSVSYLKTDLLFENDIIDNLESNASNKPLSAKQGKLLNEKLIDVQTLTDKGTTPSYIPTTEGTQSGGTYFRARDYDVEGLKGILNINSLYSFPLSGYVNAVLFALYTDTPSADTLIDGAYGSLLSSLQTTGSIDLSQYPTAKVLRITVDKDNPSYYVTLKGDKYVNQVQFKGLEERVENLENSDLNNNEKGITVELPNEIIVPVGGRVELFVRSIIKAFNPYNYQVEVVCPVGKAYPRYFLFEATASHLNQTYSLQYNVYRNDGTLIATATTSIKVVAAATSPATKRNILVFGASIIAQGYVVAELKRRLTAKSGDVDYGDGTPMNPYGKGLENISFVGRKQGTRVTGIPQEATGGWSWADYAGTGVPAYRFAISGVTSLNIGDVYSNSGMSFTITEINVTGGSGEIRCTYSGSGSPSASGTLTRVSGEGDASITYSSATSESYNPFYNNGGLDFSNYANLYCDSHIDYLVAFCGNNDYGRNMTDIVNNIKSVADAYHYAFPTGKFVICTLALPDCTGGMGANYGASASMNYFDYAKYVFDFSKAVNELAQDSNYSSFVVVAPTLQEFDCEYSYPYGNVGANNRSPETLHLGQNGIHPTENGQKMFADSLFFTFNEIL